MSFYHQWRYGHQADLFWGYDDAWHCVGCEASD